ncbi:MAG: HD domain-containing protein [Chlamydiales bacterium]
MTSLLQVLPDNPKIRSLTNHLLSEWQNYKTYENPSFNTHQLICAIIYSAHQHANQVRKDKESTPYIIHPLEVCNNLWEVGQVRNANILMSAILHDTLEDTLATEDEIQKYFGQRVLITVKEVTNAPNLSSDENKQCQIDHVPCMSQDARLVKLADRLANITDLNTNPPSSWTSQKIENYFTWGEKLLAALRGTNHQLETMLKKMIEDHSTSKEVRQ